jgi:hypothetical protein
MNQFVSKLGERSLPFFTVLRGSGKVDWGVEKQKAFDDLKNYLEHLTTFSSPKQGAASHLIHLGNSLSSQRSSGY